jgi:hypothetical protein
MNSKGHLFFSLLKSVVRIAACGIATFYLLNGTDEASVDIAVLNIAGGFLVAEMLGIYEEFVDFR